MIIFKMPDVQHTFDSKSALVVCAILFLFSFNYTVIDSKKICQFYFFGIHRKIKSNQIAHIELYRDTEEYLIITLLGGRTFSEMNWSFHKFKSYITFKHIIIPIPNSKKCEVMVILDELYPNYSVISNINNRNRL